MVIGAKQYGDFDTSRDWDKEAAEEYADGAIYMAIKILKGMKI
jgi:hypothetical protein